MLLIAIDANFRLKNLYRSSDIADPGLHTGLAYFVEDGPYREHYQTFVSQKDVSMFELHDCSVSDSAQISTCSSFRSLAQAETRDTTGLRSSGVAMAVCARHELVLPQDMGDLQKGERYVLSCFCGCAEIRQTVQYGLCGSTSSPSDRVPPTLRDCVLIQCGVPVARQFM